MPFALSVHCPAPETGEIPAAVRVLQDDLFRHRGCFVETCGWTANFTVILVRDHALDDIKALLAGVGCTVRDEVMLNFQHEESERQHYRQMFPWMHASVTHSAEKPTEVVLKILDESREEPSVPEWTAA